MDEKEEKLYRQMEKDMLLPFEDGDVDAVNAAALSGKLLQMANGAVYDENHKVRMSPAAFNGTALNRSTILSKSC